MAPETSATISLRPSLNPASYSGMPFYAAQYTRDKLGRITQRVETLGGVTTTFDYHYYRDGRSRLRPSCISGD